jgi:hypothetical protein
MKKTALVCLVACTSFSFAQTLSTLAPNNGTGGVFMNLTSNSDLTVTQFDFPLGNATVGTPASVEVWIRSGSYVGFTTSNVGWTLHDTISAVAAGTSVWTPGVLNNQITLLTGQTTAVYLHSVTAGNGLRYQGTGTTATTTFSNTDLTLFSDVARTGNVAFGGSQFTPRAFSGTVHYEAVPEPATMAVLGLGAVALMRRRKK